MKRKILLQLMASLMMLLVCLKTYAQTTDVIDLPIDTTDIRVPKPPIKVETIGNLDHCLNYKFITPAHPAEYFYKTVPNKIIWTPHRFTFLGITFTSNTYYVNIKSKHRMRELNGEIADENFTVHSSGEGNVSMDYTPSCQPNVYFITVEAYRSIEFWEVLIIIAILFGVFLIPVIGPLAALILGILTAIILTIFANSQGPCQKIFSGFQTAVNTNDFVERLDAPRPQAHYVCKSGTYRMYVQNHAGADYLVVKEDTLLRNNTPEQTITDKTVYQGKEYFYFDRVVNRTELFYYRFGKDYNPIIEHSCIPYSDTDSIIDRFNSYAKTAESRFTPAAIVYIGLERYNINYVKDSVEIDNCNNACPTQFSFPAPSCYHTLDNKVGVLDSIYDAEIERINENSEDMIHVTGKPQFVWYSEDYLSGGKQGNDNFITNTGYFGSNSRVVCNSNLPPEGGSCRNYYLVIEYVGDLKVYDTDLKGVIKDEAYSCVQDTIRRTTVCKRIPFPPVTITVACDELKSISIPANGFSNAQWVEASTGNTITYGLSNTNPETAMPGSPGRGFSYQDYNDLNDPTGHKARYSMKVRYIANNGRVGPYNLYQVVPLPTPGQALGQNYQLFQGTREVNRPKDPTSTPATCYNEPLTYADLDLSAAAYTSAVKRQLNQIPEDNPAYSYVSRLNTLVDSVQNESFNNTWSPDGPGYTCDYTDATGVIYKRVRYDDLPYTSDTSSRVYTLSTKLKVNAVLNGLNGEVASSNFECAKSTDVYSLRVKKLALISDPNSQVKYSCQTQSARAISTPGCTKYEACPSQDLVLSSSFSNTATTTYTYKWADNTSITSKSRTFTYNDLKGAQPAGGYKNYSVTATPNIGPAVTECFAVFTCYNCSRGGRYGNTGEEEEEEETENNLDESLKQDKGISMARLDLYPNPANRELNITFETPEIGKKQLYIYNNLGQLVQTVQPVLESDFATLDVSHLAKGIYTCVLGTKNGQKLISKRFIVE